MKHLALLFLVIAALITSGCSPKAYSKGAYVDPERVDLLSDKFVEADLQQIAEQLSASLLASDVANSGEKPAVILSLFTNATDEHIDMISLTKMMQNEIIKSRKFRFLNKMLRSEIAQEYEYQQSGFVSAETAKAQGSQIGADYMISGHISSIRQPVGKREIVYYKTTGELTNITTSEIVWTDEVQLKKAFKKRHVGW
ncbi:MAG: penicillin-binding protein activator LpoB [Deltaproteobacteria bacterium RIFCSPLOWO2_02_FULL_50_16]|nr:MAG: penicillin-binding protein activator LpoB [Deltaproteobacteria bacterium RIFCSPLOWO2_02_FULL_50_16]